MHADLVVHGPRHNETFTLATVDANDHEHDTADFDGDFAPGSPLMFAAALGKLREWGFAANADWQRQSFGWSVSLG